jgi:hypothetical protein
LIPPYLPERFSLLPRKPPVDNSQNPLYKAQKAATRNTRRALFAIRQA